MTRRRWIADEVDGSRAALTGDNARHLARVLRAKAGELFDIAANGEVRQGTILSVADERVEFELGEPVSAFGEGTRPIHLLLAVFKFDRMEWAIEKATELGVASIVPVIARRTDTHLASAAEKRIERWRKIAKEASQQSRRISPPEIANAIKLKSAVSAEGPASRLVLSEEEKQVSLAEALGGADPDSPAWLAVGPEGGWTAEEFKLFAENGWIAVTLGGTILRAETAAIAAVAIASTRFPRSQ